MKQTIFSTAALLLPLLAGCERATPTSTSATPPVVSEVIIQNMQYTPATLEVVKGDIVEWKNNDIVPHTATSGSFGDSGAIASGQTWRHTFSEAGEFPYTCTFHPTMKGTVVVKAK